MYSDIPLAVMPAVAPAVMRAMGNGGVGSKKFSPEQLPGLILWLDAADASTISQTGGFVSQWNDKSGNGYNATQPTGSRQMQTGLHALSGKNVVYSTANTVMIDNAAIATALNSDFTQFVVAKDFTTIGSTESRFYHGTNGIYSLFKSSVSDVVNMIFRHSNSNPGATLPSAADTIPHIYVAKKDASKQLIIDGNSSVLNSNTGAATATTSFLGGYDGAGNATSNTDYAERLLYGRVLTNAEINQIGQYLATKWNVTWTNV